MMNVSEEARRSYWVGRRAEWVIDKDRESDS